MRNGSYSLALVCTFGTTSSLKGDGSRSPRRDLGRAPRAGQLAVQAVPARPADHAGALARLDQERHRRLRGRHQGGPGRDPARLRDADLRLRGHLPRARRSAPRKGRPAVVRQNNNLSFDSNVHLHGGYVPAAHDGHPMDVIAARRRASTTRTRTTRTRRSSGTTTTRTAAPRGRSTTASSARYLLGDEREEELELPQGEYDVPLVLADHAFNKDGSFRYAENVDLGFRGDTMLVNGAVSPRHGRAAPDLPPALPQRVQRAHVRPQARQRPPDAADRVRRRPARAAGRALGRSRCTRRSGSRS